MEVHMTSLRSYAVALIAITTVLMAPATSAQDASQMRMTGILADHVWVDVGAGAGAWQVSGTWSARVSGSSGKGEFVAAILGVRSDLWVLQTGADPQTSPRSPHTHHVALLDAAVTAIPGGIRLTGNAIMTTNGNVATQFSGSPIVVEITGGDTVQLSNVKLTFQGASTEHFGSHVYDGVVTIER
jgi:hypothetical protein